MNDSHDSFEDAFARYVDRLNAGEGLDKERIRAENPNIADRLLEELEAYELFGGEVEVEAPLGTLGDYTLRRPIGRGGMGVVYEAWENSMDRRVALKVLPAGFAADERALQRFVREAKTAGRLSHPNIVGVYGMGLKEQAPYYAMEFVEGETLAQILTRIMDAEPDTETPFGKKDDTRYFANLADAFTDVADGLQHAHSKRVIHRDIKPSNLILDTEGRLRILDFGLARLEGQESLTLSGDFVGTPLYMSPEQARRRKIPVDHRTDVYSLGATMYEAICGRPPFQGRDHADTLSQIIAHDPIEPRKVNSRVPKDLETIVLKCLRKDAADRYGTAEALSQDLRRFVRGDAVEARPFSAWDRLRQRERRYRVRWVSCTLVILGVITLGGFELARRAEFHAAQLPAYRQAVRGAAAKILTGALILDVGSSGERPLVQWDRDPWRTEDFHNFGRMGSMGPLENASDALESATEWLPEQPDAHFQLARALHTLGRGDEAAAALERALRCDPAFLPARLLRGSLSGADTDKGQRARNIITRAYAGVDGWERHYVESSQHFRDKAWFDAARSFDALLRVVRSFETEPFVGFFLEVHLRKGISHLEARQFEEAKLAFSAAEALSPGLIEPRLFLAKAYYLEGDELRAEQVLETLHASSELAERDSVANWSTVVFHSLHDFARARRWAERIQDRALSERLCMYFSYRLGELSHAIEVGRRLQQSGSRDPIALLVLAVALFDQLESLARADRKAGLDEVIQIARQVRELDEDLRLFSDLLEIAEEERNRLMNIPKTTTLTLMAPCMVALPSAAAHAQKGFFSPEGGIGAANTPFIDSIPVISPNGLELFYTILAAPGIGGDSDIYVAIRESKDVEFGEGVPVAELNTPNLDIAQGISDDGLTLYVGAYRPGTTDWDLWEARRPSLTEPFGELENLVELNSELDDAYAGSSVTRDGLEFYFDRRFGEQNIELFVAWRSSREERWGTPVPLSELNRPVLPDASPSISPDGLTVIYNTYWRDGDFGQHDLWMATRSRRFDDDGNRVPFGEPVNLGPRINSAAYEWQARFSWDWPAPDSMLYYSAGMPSQWDIHAARWHPDCNENGVDDREDIRRGNSRDADADDIPDECGPGLQAPVFLRGDCNDDGALDISDAVCILNWLFLGSTAPGCIAALNTNGDDDVDIADSVYSLGFAFLGGPAPVDPYPECGRGTLPTDVECETAKSCPQQ